MLPCDTLPATEPSPEGEGSAGCAGLRPLHPPCPKKRLSGHPSPFRRNVYITCRLSGEEAAQRVVAAWAAADLWPDAPAALRAVHAAGLRLAVLTNGSGKAWWR